MLRREGSDGLNTSASRGSLTLGGQTLRGATDGEWLGQRQMERVLPRKEWLLGMDRRAQVCYDVSMPAYSAAMLVLNTTV